MNDLALLITDISFAIFFVLNVLFGLWVYLKSSKKATSRMFLLMVLAIGIYQISHVFGTNVTLGDASRQIFTFHLALIYAVCFSLHWLMLALERRKEYTGFIGAAYVIGTALVALFIVRPETFLLESLPRMYLPNYYVAGSLYWLFIAFIACGFVASIVMLNRSYRMSDAVHKNRILYYLAATIIAYPVASLGFFLAYNIEIDPLIAALSNLAVVPLAYAVLRYDAMDIRSAARKALVYFIFVAATALFVLAANVGSDIIRITHPGMPGWIVPLLSSLVIVFLAGYIWERMRDLDILKYEFVTVVTHKFRTPLTRIKWAAEMLKKSSAAPEERDAVGEIESANESLVELTDMLVGLRSASDASYGYVFEAADICVNVERAVKAVRPHMDEKEIDLALLCPSKPVYASLDARRMAFALQILIENAAAYSLRGGKVKIEVSEFEGDCKIAVTDAGIGIAREDLVHVFEKFWRSKEAKTADTEGMGIGLYMARDIVERHGGSVTVASEGLGKGTTFTVNLPFAAKE
jgi:signal transduction histidine kinase